MIFFEKGHALRDQLSWTHYRLLIKLEEENARDFYIDEAIAGNWSTRQLERQINSLYYERILLRGKWRQQTVIKNAECYIQIPATTYHKRPIRA